MLVLIPYKWRDDYYSSSVEVLQMVVCKCDAYKPTVNELGP